MAGQKPGGRRSGSAKQGPSGRPRPPRGRRRPARARPPQGPDRRQAEGIRTQPTGHRPVSERDRDTERWQITPGRGRRDRSDHRGQAKPRQSRWPIPPGDGAGCSARSSRRSARWADSHRHADPVPVRPRRLDLPDDRALRQHVTLVCSDKGLINCEEVTTSSRVDGVRDLPGRCARTGVLRLHGGDQFTVGLAAELACGPMAPARLRGRRHGLRPLPHLRRTRQIHAICLWCTSVHVATFLIFALLIFHAAFNWDDARRARRPHH